MKRTILLLPALLALAACDTMPKAPDRPVVNVQIPVPCVDPTTPRAPAVSTNVQLQAMADDTLVLTLARERLVLISWAAEVTPVLEGCRVLPGAP
jgi:hypothetical protein